MQSAKKAVSGTVIAITGAASGIGRALARELASRGADLALCDLDAEGLEVAASSAGAGTITTAVVDVSDRAAVEAWAEQVIREHGRVDGIINNAGVTVCDTILDIGYEDLEWILGINLWGVIYGTKSFLPHLVERDSGWVVNISSIFGIIAFPTQGAYNATKFAVRGFTEALRQELMGTGVTALSVHPGGIRTNIVRNSRYRRDPDGGERTLDEMVREFERIAKTSPEQAAKVIVDAMEAQESRLLVGPDAKFLESIQRLFPDRYERVLGPLVSLLRR